MFATVINGYFMNKVIEMLYFLHSEAHRNEQVRVVRQGHRQLTRITERLFPEKIPDGKRKKCVVRSSSHERFRKSWIQWWCPNCKVGPCVEWCFSRYICTVYCIIYDNLWKTFFLLKPWRTNVPIILIFL